MPAKSVQIVVDREPRSVTPGAVRGQAIIALANLAEGEQVLLEVTGDVDIPISPTDLIFIRGGEAFSIGDGTPHVDDNPIMRQIPAATLNGQPIPANGHPPHAKMSGHQLKALVNAGDVDLWSDLDGLADEIIEDHDRLILQSVDSLFTVPRAHEDRFYEVKVLLDGEEREMRFPAMITVQEAIRRRLPPHDRPHVADFEMVDVDIGPTPLLSHLTLKDAGVRDCHVLSITKKNGGGG
ncbi:hypothetical protein ACS7SF_22860 (plasmid) [Ralstonia sp. 25C]|uniref:hypothetical protein n=1 Tax=Ralstonia sp. 25C TaxID=3447363 RepID=UPI003F755507